jgi:DivIVA domain-containing protein
MRRKRAREQDASDGSDRRITPEDVQQVEFRLAFRGYNERDVDAFLDRVTEDLAAYLAEIDRLRGRGGAETIGSPDASSAEAEEVLARAREEAAEIVRAAERQAEAIRSVGAGDARAAVAPFLSMERGFLQGLGSTIQAHAEEIRRMVLALRTPAGPPGTAEPPAPEPPVAEVEEPSDVQTRSEVEAPPGTAGGPGGEEPIVVAEADGAAPGSEAPEETIVVEPAGGPAVSSGSPPTEPRERSLRELFWGED